MRAVDHEIETKRLKERLLGKENGRLACLQILAAEASAQATERWCGERTLLSSEILSKSTLFTFEQNTFDTSRSFLPHSSVLVARNMHEAATS